MRPTIFEWRIPLALVALSAVPAIAGTARLVEIASNAAVTPANARFMDAPWPVVLHIIAVVIYSMLGAVQFSAGIRRRSSRWHRASGRVLVAAGVLAATTGLWMTLRYAWPSGDGQILYLERLVFGTAMLLSLVLAVTAIRICDFHAHGRWMIRAYAIGLGAGTQVFAHLPWFLLMAEPPGELPRAVMMGAGWVINVLAAEWIVRRPSHADRRRRDPSLPAELVVAPLSH
ncbi:DUF2306 domain-containing protein [Gemmatimonas groenlandica]|uniref:DUF2306 domain-containing protein n=1 Tax=Gemmatimonas groenlandica TaxID=2732249 RepID=A0A6M4IUP3_9BACT|nr:DUF2306 domain-containing protein [Gemmatimonas groenlandica]QJR37868.1 DUF2306 domain-containing protein [Gemmatimonas groenlandica]